MQRKQLQPWVGLPNILCQDFVVPELLQDRATPAALADAVQQWLTPEAAPQVAAVQQRFAALHQSLLRDTSTLAAQAIEVFDLCLSKLVCPGPAQVCWPGSMKRGVALWRGPWWLLRSFWTSCSPLQGLTDSKKLTAKRREALFDEIRAKALCFCVAAGQR